MAESLCGHGVGERKWSPDRTYFVREDEGRNVLMSRMQLVHANSKR